MTKRISYYFCGIAMFIASTIACTHAEQRHNADPDNAEKKTAEKDLFEITQAGHMHLYTNRQVFEDVNFRFGEVDMFTSRMIIENNTMRIQNGMQYEYKNHIGTVSDLIFDIKKKHVQIKGIKNYMPEKEMYITSENAEYHDGNVTFYDVAYYECNEKPQFTWKIRSKKVLYNKDETKLFGAQLCIGSIPLVFYPGTLTITNKPRNDFHISIMPDIFLPSNVGLMLIPSVKFAFSHNNALCVQIPISMYGVVLGFMSYNLSRDNIKINLDGSITGAERTFKLADKIQDDDKAYIEDVKRRKVRGHAHAYFEWLASKHLTLQMQGHLVSDRFFAYNFTKFYPTYTENMLHNHVSIDFRKHSLDAHVGMHGFQGFREIPGHVLNTGMWYYGPLAMYQHSCLTKYGIFKTALLGGYFRRSNSFYCGNAMANISYKKHLSLQNIIVDIEPSISFSSYPVAYSANLVAQCRVPLYLQCIAITPIVGQILSFSNITSQRQDTEPISMLHANQLDELCSQFSFQRKAKTFAGASLDIYTNHTHFLGAKCIYVFDEINKNHKTYLEAQMTPSQQILFFGRAMFNRSECSLINVGVNLQAPMIIINLGWFYRNSPNNYSFGLDSLFMSPKAVRTHQPIKLRSFHADVELLCNRHFSINGGIDLGDKDLNFVQGSISFTYKNKIFDITLGYARYQYAMGDLSPSPHSIVFGINLKELKFL